MNTTDFFPTFSHAYSPTPDATKAPRVRQSEIPAADGRDAKGLESRHIYWLSKDDFETARAYLVKMDYRLSSTLLTPCQVLKSSGQNLVYAPARIWSGLCSRQGSWYRDSDRDGNILLVSDHRLPAPMDPWLDATMTQSDFRPDELPEREQLEEIVASDAYQDEKPDDWEGIGWFDAALFKIMFRLKRFWKRGENLKKYWLHQRANHANFVSSAVTTVIDGESVPYSVTENAGVCSSCAEFFNVIKPGQRKLVRSCPGAIVFGGTNRDDYYDVIPQPSSSTDSSARSLSPGLEQKSQ